MAWRDALCWKVSGCSVGVCYKSRGGHGVHSPVWWLLEHLAAVSKYMSVYRSPSNIDTPHQHQHTQPPSPWAPVAGAWFGVPIPMEGIYSTSLVLPECDPVRAEPFALFCAEDRNGCHLEVRRRNWQSRVRAER